jgi:hypothetical protein
VYRSYVFQRPEFIEYFNLATPVGELGRLNIGSRPASRKQTKGIEGLRAIPWVFAWTQTRFHLPVRERPVARQFVLLHASKCFFMAPRMCSFLA